MRACLFLLAAAALAAFGLGGRAAADEGGWVSLFDGSTLNNWSGNPEFWRVEDGAITGETTAGHMVKGNTFLIWKGGETKGDFDLEADFKLIGGNSGIQYRSFEVPGKGWVVGGYQADMDGKDNFTGIIYGEKYHNTILAPRGSKAVIEPNHKVKVVGEVSGGPKEILKHIKHEDWNTYHITCRGYHMEQRINGVVTCECDDEDTAMRRDSGIIALQLHAGYVMKVQFKNIKLKQIPGTATSSVGTGRQAKENRVHRRTSEPRLRSTRAPRRLPALAGELNENVPQVHAVVVKGWPADPHILDDAACVVVFADGGEGHPLMKHLDEFDALMKKGVGLVCIHYAVEIPPGKGGEHMADWTGGYFETNWSVNPTWTAHYKHLPQHEVTRGVKPFATLDEWYYHMRFLGRHERRHADPHRPAPGLHAQPFRRHAQRQQGRAAGCRQWRVADNGLGPPAAGRRPRFRRHGGPLPLELGERQLPQAGLERHRLGGPRAGAGKRRRLPHAHARRAQGQPRRDQGQTANGGRLQRRANPRLAQAMAGGVGNMRRRGEGRGVRGRGKRAEAPQSRYGEVERNNTSRRLYAAGLPPCPDELRLHRAEHDLGRRRGATGGGFGPPVSCRTSAAFALAQARQCAMPRSCANQDTGGPKLPPVAPRTWLAPLLLLASWLAFTGTPVFAAEDEHPAAKAVAGLDVAPGLAATLFASEPMIANPTNIDVDDQGRVWVCDVVNYRGNNGKRPAGDRILILEDTDGDGKADKSTVFYQGRDIDSAMGICVLGNKVIVSCSPNVFVFTDDGDGKADKKEALFTKTGPPQHDHSAHTFRLRARRQAVLELRQRGQIGPRQATASRSSTSSAGTVVNDGQPYRDGMVFRCDLDGSNFEVLAHNFRNNYELAVDSFGTLWQSDNDDDGNRGVRINYLMEYGNYGYRDEMTGAGWTVPRTNLETEIPPATGT